jgi:hypothetical protein
LAGVRERGRLLSSSPAETHEQTLERLTAELRATFGEAAASEAATIAALEGTARALARIAQESLEPTDPGPNTAQLGA